MPTEEDLDLKGLSDHDLLLQCLWALESLQSEMKSERERLLAIEVEIRRMALARSMTSTTKEA